METWKNQILKIEKHLNCTRWDWNEIFANIKYNWEVAKFGNSNVNLQRIWNEIAFEIHWKMHREKVFESNKTRICISKEIPRAWRVGESKELTICNFPSNFCNYSLSQVPSDGKLIDSQFRFRICVGLVLAKYSLCVLPVWY